MQVRALVSRVVFPVLALLVLGCEGSQPFEPTDPSDPHLLATKTTGASLASPGTANAVAASEVRINVNWVDNSGNETGFEVYRSTTGASGTFAKIATTAANVTLYADDKLDPIAYCYKVRTVRVVGNNTTYSDFSNTSCATPPPNAPSGVSAVAAQYSTINLSWQDNSNSETNFQIWRAVGDAGVYSSLGMTSANVLSFADATGISGTRYCYNVRALRQVFQPDGSSIWVSSTVSSSACATAPPPTPASNATARALSSNTIRVGWSRNTTRDQQYHVYRSVDAGGTWTVAGTSQFAIFDDSGVQSEQQICYRVAAFDAGGEAPPSNTACAAAPNGPTNFSAAPVDSETFALTWSDNSSIEDGYEVWVHWSHPDCSGMNASWYEGVTLVARLPAGTTSYNVTPGSMGCGDGSDSQFYYVAATKDGGYSSPSAEVQLR